MMQMTGGGDWRVGGSGELHWRIQEAPPARPPKGPDSFILTYKFLEINCLKSWRRPMRLAPPTGNPGYVTELSGNHREIEV